jgi:hypothetical protein
MGIMANGWSMALYPYMGSLHLYDGQGKILIFFSFFNYEKYLALVYHWSENMFLVLKVIEKYFSNR